MLISIILVGIFSCLVLDLWQQIIRTLFGIPASDWGLVGRWFLTVIEIKKLIVFDIETRNKFERELPVGWLVHYFVAILYALVFWILAYYHVLTNSLIDGIIFGGISVVVPWFFFLPCMGKGVLGLRTSKPILVCTMAFFTHIVFGASIGILFNIF
jgi:hypothetical protein